MHVKLRVESVFQLDFNFKFKGLCVLILTFDLPQNKGKCSYLYNYFSISLYIDIDKITHHRLFVPSIQPLSLTCLNVLWTLPHVESQFKFQSIHSISQRKTFFPSSPRTSRYIFPSDDSNISVWCPRFAPVLSPCQEKLYFSYVSHSSPVPTMNPVLTEAAGTGCDRAEME